MNTYAISIATEKDLKEVAHLEAQCFPHDSDKLSLKQYQLLHKKKSITIFMIKHAEKIIASATVIVGRGSSIGRIYSFAVDKNFRCTQVAKDLYHHLENFFLKKKCQAIQLEVRTDNIAAIKFYKKNGFITFADLKNFYVDGKDAFRMKKILI